MSLRADEFYIEDGKWVFTERYLLRRGECCGNGCRHCPFDYIKVDPIRRATLAPARPYFLLDGSEPG